MIALIFDTETTGFRSEQFTPEIVQIGAILQDTESLRVLAELNLIVRAKEPIPKQSGAIHGITDELSAKFGIDSDVADNMFALLVARADVLVAHNIQFDTDIIDGAWPVSKSIINTKVWFCTMRELVSVIKLPHSNGNGFHNEIDPHYKAPKLIEAYNYFFHKDFENQHDAMADVRACRDVYFAMHGHTTNAAP